jgi:hypothetical protein
MNAHSRSIGPAQVDIVKARFCQKFNWGIEFKNEIDAWAQMEFRFRHQIQKMKNVGNCSPESTPLRRETKTFHYSFREAIFLD